MGKLILGALIISFAPILVKAGDIGPTLIAFYRCVVAAVFQLGLLLLIPRLRPERAFMRSPQVWLASAGAGLFFALDLFVWHRSVVYTGAGMGTILANTQVFYVAVIGVLLYGEKVTARFALAVPLAFLGVYLLAIHGASPARGEHYMWGVACGVTTGVMYTVFLVFLRKAEKVLGTRGTLWNLAWMSAIAGFFLLLFSLMEGTFVIPGKADVLWVVLLGLGPQTCGWLLITRGVGEVPISKAGLILLLQPLLATVMGTFIYGESFDVVQVVGACLTVGGIYLGVTRNAEA